MLTIAAVTELRHCGAAHDPPHLCKRCPKLAHKSVDNRSQDVILCPVQSAGVSDIITDTEDMKVKAVDRTSVGFPTDPHVCGMVVDDVGQEAERHAIQKMEQRHRAGRGSSKPDGPQIASSRYQASETMQKPQETTDPRHPGVSGGFREGASEWEHGVKSQNPSGLGIEVSNSWPEATMQTERRWPLTH